MTDCLFCAIVKGEKPCDKVYEDEHCIAFKDIFPKAQVHVLLIPKKHIKSLLELEAQDHHLMGHLSLCIPKIAKDLGLEEGFKIQVNTGVKGGQEIDHLHYHILGNIN